MSLCIKGAHCDLPCSWNLCQSCRDRKLAVDMILALGFGIRVLQWCWMTDLYRHAQDHAQNNWPLRKQKLEYWSQRDRQWVWSRIWWVFDDERSAGLFYRTQPAKHTATVYAWLRICQLVTWKFEGFLSWVSLKFSCYGCSVRRQKYINTQKAKCLQ